MVSTISKTKQSGVTFGFEKKYCELYFQNFIAGNIEEMWGICQKASVMTLSIITRGQGKMICGISHGK